MKQTQRNLIPVCPNPSPDYYCTWQTQLYATSDGKPEAQRRILGERETAYEITDAVLRAGDRLVIPGQCDREIGTEAPPANDTSEPGVVIRIEEN